MYFVSDEYEIDILIGKPFLVSQCTILVPIIEDPCRRCGQPVGSDPFNYCTVCGQGPYCPTCWPRHASLRDVGGCRVSIFP